MKEMEHVGQLKVLDDLLKIKETDGILRVFWKQGSDYYTLEGYWYFPTEGKETLTYAIEKADLDWLAEIGEVKLYHSENPKAIYDIEITDKGELRLAKLSRHEHWRTGFSIFESKGGQFAYPVGAHPRN